MRIVSALWLLFFAVTIFAEEESGQAGLFLADVPVVSGALPESFDARAALTLDLHSDDVPALQARFADVAGVEVVGASGAALRVRVAPGARFRKEPTERDHAASWMIDYDQPSVSALSNLWREQSTAELGSDSDVGLQALVAFTGAQIDDPNYRNGVLIASQVARRREGDCTEYGVLQTALGRQAGYASRLVFGLLLVASNDQLKAYGHAWSEMHHDQDWWVADATQPTLQQGVQGAWHVPILIIENEGPSYALEVIKFATARPDSVTLIHNDAPASAETRPDNDDD